MDSRLALCTLKMVVKGQAVCAWTGGSLCDTGAHPGGLLWGPKDSLSLQTKIPVVP